MDKQILEILKQIQSTQQQHTDILKSLDTRVSVIEKKLDSTHEEVARAREDITETRADIRLIKIATVENTDEISKLKAIK